MNDFEGLLATDHGFKSQRKPAPMAASKGSSAATGGTSRSMGNSNSFAGSFMNDGDSLFGSMGNQKNQETDGFGDLFGGSASARYQSKSENRAADSPFNLDSIYRASSDTGSKCMSTPPVFDKPVYDDDIFEGVPGLKSSARVNYDDVFASVASAPDPDIAATATAGGNAAFGDLLGGFVKAHLEANSSDGKKIDKNDNGVAEFEDLLPGFGSNRTPADRHTSDSTTSRQANVGSAREMSDAAADPFKVFEPLSVPQESSSAQFVDPLEEINKLSSSGSTKLDSSSVSNAKEYDDADPFDGLGESVPAFSSERNNRKDRSPSRTDTGSARPLTDKNSTEKSSVRSPERRSQNMTHADPDHEFYQASFSPPTYSSNDSTSEESNVNVDMPPKYERNFESNDDVWLVVSEIPLVTEPTTAPPPSRPPPPRPVQVPKSESGSSANTNTRRKGNESSFSPSTQYSQAPKSVPGATRVPMTNPFDELEDFAMGRSLGGDDELADGASGEELEMNTVAAAMKEAMDRAEAKFRHAREVREREGSKATRRENVQLEREEKAVQEEREKQERLRLQKEREERERKRLEKEREEKEREQRRLEREREKARHAVERATREARERAAAEALARAERAAVDKAKNEARERAERAAVQRAQAEARVRAAADAKERAEKAAAEARERANAEARAENEARLRAERAAAERAAAEARERAAAEARERAAAKKNQQKNDDDLESFFSMGSRPSSVPRPGTNSSDSVFGNPYQSRQEPNVAKRSADTSSSIRKASPANFVDDLSSIFGATPPSGEFQEVEGETEERRRARLERHQRTRERAAKALAEKNERDLQTQREQTERHRIAETLDSEIRRWAAGKEGNLRALLSTLQYVLWPECGWQPVSLTDLITGASVKKAYRKATLCIHPDKVQQKGATLQQKYIAEKVFDLLKEAWNKLNSEELF